MTGKANIVAAFRKLPPALLLAAAVFAAYANVYGNAFVLDDMMLIVQNGLLRDWGRLPDLLTGLTNAGSGMGGGFYRPLQMLLYFLIYQVFGLSAPAFHFFNVALHAANAALMHRLGCRLGFSPAACFAAALLWAVHPLHTEAVAYMASTADSLFTLFCLSGLLVLLPDFAPRRVWAAGLLFVLALGSKESAIVFPALAAITLFLVSPERTRFSTYLKTWPLWLIAAAYAFAWMMWGSYVVYDPRGLSETQVYAQDAFNRVLTALATLPAYLKLLVWPAGLHMERTYPIFTSLWSWQVLAGVLIVAGAMLQIFWRRGLALSFGLLWFAAAHAPNTGILVPINALVAEHWMYLPTVGLFLGVAQALSTRLDRKAAAVAVALAAILLGAKTHLQNRVWFNPGTFYEHILACGESTGRIHNNLGLFYWGRGDFDRAIEHFRFVAADPGLRMEPMMMGVHTNFALIYLGARMNGNGIVTPEELDRALPLSRHTPEAIAELEQALKLAPDFHWASRILARIYAHQGDRMRADYYSSRAQVMLPPPPPAPAPLP